MVHRWFSPFLLISLSVCALAQTSTTPPSTQTPSTPAELPSAPSITILNKQREEDAKIKAAQKANEDAARAETAKQAAIKAAAEKEITDKIANEKAKADAIEQDLKKAEATQQNASGNQTGDDATTTLSVAVVEIPVVFTVVDRHNRYIKDQKREDFAIYEDKQSIGSVRSFRSESDLPLRVGLLVDASSSIRERFKFEQEAAIEFLQQIVRPKMDKAFVMQFDDVPLINTPFTNNQEKLAEGVRVIRAGGGTALFDAIYSAGRDVIMKNKDAVSVRKAIILLTDGDDVNSHVTREEAIEMAQRAEVIVYCISTNTSSTRTRGDKILERIAEATGGRAFFPFVAQDVANAFQDIEEELRSQYSLSFLPHYKLADGSFHSIEIVSVNKKLHIRARKGFFTPGKAGTTKPVTSGK
jgi:Ca-activated chloride channel family protein